MPRWRGGSPTSRPRWEGRCSRAAPAASRSMPRVRPRWRKRLKWKWPLSHSLTSAKPAGNIAGSVRITLARVLADGFLAERLEPLQAKFPELDTRAARDLTNLSLARREAEIALRLARPASGELLARRVMTLDYGFFAAPEYAARISSGEQPVFIAFDDASEYVPEAAWAQRFLTGRRVPLRANSQMRPGAGGTRRPWRRAVARPGRAHARRAGAGAVRRVAARPRAVAADASRRCRLARVRTVADHLVELSTNTGSDHEPAARDWIAARCC